ncbi:TetR/AcrR family transcriptional regulator [Geminocystis sp. NIES-3709]|uniref:TetR/AcrR family transcriptional regulator n=1 Tax=Geminocystis sp. NIES-3709 TaxID=1617448 RepID=UPI0005FCA0C2|nr:TetR/AcrR family transcriptional regulator [Geminocystis sp. NIES-3709]BAQ64714.1 transcriptional regulator [Geminocystis sp. NIES-3709]
MTLTYHQQKTEAKIEQILQGALSEFLTYGYLGTSMDKIAQTAGVSKQTLYTHFGDKEGLFKALIYEVTTKKFQLVWSKSLEGKPEIVLKELAERIVNEVNDPQYLAFVHVIVTSAKTYPELGELFLENVAKPAMNILIKYFDDCADLNLADSEAIAHIFVNTLIHHILTQETLQGKKVIPIKSERIINNLIKMITNTE